MFHKNLGPKDVHSGLDPTSYNGMGYGRNRFERNDPSVLLQKEF